MPRGCAQIRSATKRFQVKVLIVGLNRSSSFTAKHLYDRVIKPFEKSCFFDIIVSIWLIDPEGKINNPRSSESGNIESQVAFPLNRYKVTTMSQSYLWNSVAHLHQELIAKGDDWKDSGRSLRNALIFLRSLEASSITLTGAEDVVLFIRPDVLISRFPSMKLRALFLAIANRRNRKILMSPIWGNYGGLNDRLGMMTGNASQDYFGRLGRVQEWLRSERPFHSERYLLNSSSDIQLRRSIFAKIWRVRLGGRIEEGDLRRFRQPLVWQLLKKRRTFL